MYIDILHGLRDTVRTKNPEKWTMLQYTGRFCSRNKEQRDNTAAYLMLSWPDSSWLLPVPSAEISIKGGGAFFFLMLRILLSLRRKIWKGFHKMFSRNIFNTFEIAGKSVWFHKGTILKEM